MKIRLIKKNFGFTILLLTVTLLLISTMLILFSAQYSTLRLKISSNLSGNQQAFEAAQAGIEAAIPYFQSNYSAIIAQQSGGFLQPYQNSSTQNVALANNSSYSFVFSNSTANNFQLITITSTGTNADGTSTRILSQQIYPYSSGAVPSDSIQTQANMTLKDSSIVTNTQTNSNIRTGGTITIQNSAQTVTNTGVSSTASTQGPDISSNDSLFASESANSFFQNYFGVSSSTLQSIANYTYTNNSDTNYNLLNGVVGAIIWINQINNLATINGSTTIGSLASPVILVVNGNFTLSGFATVYGVVFVLNPTSDTRITSSASINGALASTDDIRLSTSALLNYNASVLYRLPTTGASPSYAKLPGSWKDF